MTSVVVFALISKANLTDEFFHRELVMQVAAADDALRARFDVVLAMR
jgi:hypothetical protein